MTGLGCASANMANCSLQACRYQLEERQQKNGHVTRYHSDHAPADLTLDATHAARYPVTRFTLSWARTDIRPSCQRTTRPEMDRRCATCASHVRLFRFSGIHMSFSPIMVWTGQFRATMWC
jgi:hypothetical protein